MSYPHSIDPVLLEPDLVQRWFELRRHGSTSYEELVLGALGRYSAKSALIVAAGGDRLALKWAGHGFETWLGREVWDLSLADLDPHDEGTFRRAWVSALETGEPTRLVCQRVRNGSVETVTLTALPLTQRWGGPVVLLFSDLVGQRTSLVEAIFRSTRQGILALSTLRDDAGRPEDFQIVAINDGGSTLFRQSTEALLWRRLSEFLLPADRRPILDRLCRVLQDGSTDAFEYSFDLRPGGGWLHLQVEAGCVGDLLALVVTDVGGIKAREESYRLLFEDNPMPMWVCDGEDQRFLAVNKAAVDHYGFSAQDFSAMRVHDLLSGDDPSVPAKADAMPVKSAGELQAHRRSDGSQIETLSYARPIRYQDRPAVLLAATDVTERRRIEAHVAHLAHHDFLTGLPNRALFLKRLSEALVGLDDPASSPGGVAVLCLDLDGFKGVNDRLGHPAGDELLCLVASRLRAEVPGRADLVARLGGDEFSVLVMGDEAMRRADAMAGRIVDALSAPFLLKRQEVFIGVSIGLAEATPDARTSDRLLANADLALYRAKREGRRTHRWFDADVDTVIQASRALEQDLRAAVADKALGVHYQPLVDCARDEIVGCEALVRWRHPVHGFISPAEFIPLAETIGLILDIGDYVLREACREATSWPEHVKVAVNLSPAQFHPNGNHLVDTVKMVLDETGLDPARLEVEITESILLKDTETNLATLARLRALGVRIAVDDFGTGYSSLTYLRVFSFDKLKIDKSFVQELGARPECRAIVAAITGLGSSLGITINAEGVETPVQLRHLRELGCDEVQGFLFGRPVPPERIRPILATGGPAFRLREAFAA
ncbi:EAL domain-containing protein [Enterovirga rhinocerotis]|uniref:PAS domain S-box-containing protein/diguanylate cyclase (GGDEF)-like protein n=1 Tax=Enterovirga rhinocerotis TaxID=1339210 RepID=A0A4R7BTJ8_9HYPH|nr:EAL domain-containing protein [Enterovirga rhinocerotis]TDR89050.1 PAS domain S-box-containing protein/diguanylate cyclase (GGDEF)-like protein [Enterovirga rhinocerotis]